LKNLIEEGKKKEKNRKNSSEGRGGEGASTSSSDGKGYGELWGAAAHNEQTRSKKGVLRGCFFGSLEGDMKCGESD